MYCLCFFNCFMVSSLNFIFVYVVIKCSNLILLHIAFQFSQHHLIEEMSFLHCIFLLPLSQINWPYVCGFTSVLSILFHWSVFVPVPYCFDYYSFVILSEVREPDSSNSIFLSQDCFGYSWSFVFPYKLWNFFVLVLWKMPVVVW